MTMSANQLSLGQEDITRETEALILQALARTSQKKLSLAMKPAFDFSESTISRWNDGEYQKWARALSILGLRVVPQSARVVTEAYLHSLETLAEIGLKAEKTRPKPLGWD